ncbi:MAG: helix-turn-helix domain-containing protein, partial [Bacilli bacterium]
MSYNADIYISIEEGMALLVIYDDQYHEYYINCHIKINKNVKFSIIPLDDQVQYTIYHADKNVYYKYYNSCDEHKNIEQKLKLNKIYSYSFCDIKALEKEYNPHKYYELIFINCGSCHAMINDQEIELKQNDICIIDLANTSFKVIDTSTRCNCLYMIFDSKEPIESILLNKHIHASKNILKLIDILANIDNKAYEYDLYLSTLQLIIISLYQKVSKKTPSNDGHKVEKYYANDSFREIISFINDNLDQEINIDYLSHRFEISHGSILKLFKDNLKMPFKKYLTDARLRKSKELIKSHNYSINEIASMIGFRSAYYFSKKFYDNFGLTFNEYVKMIYPD